MPKVEQQKWVFESRKKENNSRKSQSLDQIKKLSFRVEKKVENDDKQKEFSNLERNKTILENWVFSNDAPTSLGRSFSRSDKKMIV